MIVAIEQQFPKLKVFFSVTFFMYTFSNMKSEICSHHIPTWQESVEQRELSQQDTENR